MTLAELQMQVAEWRDPAGTEIADELADVMILAAAFANKIGLDLAEAVTRRLAKNAQKYPAAERRDDASPTTSAEDPSDDDEYDEEKEEDRAPERPFRRGRRGR